MSRPKSLMRVAKEKAASCGESFLVSFFGFGSSILIDKSFVDSLKDRPGFKLDAHFRRSGNRVYKVRV